MRLNNRGFAITSIIYSMLVLFLTLVLLIISNLASRKAVFDKEKNELLGNFSSSITNSVIEEPDLYDGTLTPVIYDGTNWMIVDPSSKWYDYENQQWANAVILNNGVNTRPGTVIDLTSDVKAMFVWIPRYEYKYTNLGERYANGTQTEPGAISIKFISVSQTQPSKNNYKIHPAFTFGITEQSGIWVGKFETSHTEITSYSQVYSLNCQGVNCSIADGIRILPDMIALRNNNISNYFYVTRSMNRSNNSFGFDASLTDTHMMKNNEWGAVAYLSQSKYGKYGNDAYESVNKEVYKNNSNRYYTGRSSGKPSASGHTNSGTYKYDVEINGTGASTTGNIYGVYDMVGGSYDYVMGVFANSSGTLWSGGTSTNSGFTGLLGSSGTSYTGIPFPNSKYYEVFKAYSGTTTDENKACSGNVCYGHALSETYNWYSDYGQLVSTQYPWMNRGGAYYNQNDAGIFNYNLDSGGASANYSFRVVLATP